MKDRKDRVLVKFSSVKDYIDIRTVSRELKAPFGFTMLRDDFITLERDGKVIVRDMFSFAEFWRNTARGTVTICFTWLNNHGYQYVGRKQTVELPYKEVIDFALGDREKQRTWKVLSIEAKNSPRLVFECPTQLRKCLENNIIRRKLFRFLRDNFKWWGAEKICFYSDFVPYSFFFREYHNGVSGITGGLIYHSSGDLSTGYYSIHT